MKGGLTFLVVIYIKKHRKMFKRNNLSSDDISYPWGGGRDGETGSQVRNYNYSIRSIAPRKGKAKEIWETNNEAKIRPLN